MFHDVHQRNLGSTEMILNFTSESEVGRRKKGGW